MIGKRLVRDWYTNVEKDTITYTFKMAVGCGGNCGTCEPTGELDCVNDCTNQYLTTDPCSVTSGTHCDFLSWSNSHDNIITKQNYKEALDLPTGATCKYTYNHDTGNFHTPANKFPNWCSGANMHFDLTNYLLGLGTEKENAVFRYKRVQCPKTKDSC